jgi:predicted nucleic acid-binding protein
LSTGRCRDNRISGGVSVRLALCPQFQPSTAAAQGRTHSRSTITVVEIVRGYQKAQQFQRHTAFLPTLASEEVFPLDTASAELAGRITGDL